MAETGKLCVTTSRWFCQIAPVYFRFDDCADHAHKLVRILQTVNTFCELLFAQHVSHCFE